MGKGPRALGGCRSVHSGQIQTATYQPGPGAWVQENACTSASSVLKVRVRSKPANSVTNNLRPGFSWVSLQARCQNPIQSYVAETSGDEMWNHLHLWAIPPSFTGRPSSATINTKLVQQKYFLHKHLFQFCLQFRATSNDSLHYKNAK